MDLSADSLAQYGPVGLVIAAVVVAVRAYMTSGSSSVWTFLLNSFLKSAPSRAESYALHAASTTSVIDPALKILKLVELALLKVQSNAGGSTPAVPDKPPESPVVEVKSVPAKP